MFETNELYSRELIRIENLTKIFTNGRDKHLFYHYIYQGKTYNYVTLLSYICEPGVKTFERDTIRFFFGNV